MTNKAIYQFEDIKLSAVNEIEELKKCLENNADTLAELGWNVDGIGYRIRDLLDSLTKI